MFTAFPKRGFTLRELLVVITIIGALLALTLPLADRSRDASRRIQCASTLKQFGVALLVHVNSRGYLPPATSTNVAFAPAGSMAPAATTSPETTTMAGFSWIVKILPFLGEPQAYALIDKRSHSFDHSVAPFADTMTETGAPFDPATQASNRHLATLDFSFLHCPADSGERYSVPVDGSGQPANYRAATSAPLSGHALWPAIGLARTNYVVLAATHLNCLAQAPQPPPLAEEPNGVIVPTVATKISQISDGQAHTFLACETREQGYNSWYDGSTTWTVGILSSTGDYHWQAVALQPADKSYDPVTNPLTLWRASPGGTQGKSALNFGASQRSQKFFLAHAGSGTDEVAAAHGVSKANPWRFGPSSGHPGIVNHLVADGSVKSVYDEVDPTLYMRLITRAGEEPSPIEID